MARIELLIGKKAGAMVFIVSVTTSRAQSPDDREGQPRTVTTPEEALLAARRLLVLAHLPGDVIEYCNVEHDSVDSALAAVEVSRDDWIGSKA